MKFKEDVEYTIDGVVRILLAAEHIWEQLGKEVVITSLMDGKHMEKSKHYSGEAADLRIHYFTPEQQLDAVRYLRTLLGTDYDVVHHTTHIHVEYDPK